MVIRTSNKFSTHGHLGELASRRRKPGHPKSKGRKCGHIERTACLANTSLSVSFSKKQVNHRSSTRGLDRGISYINKAQTPWIYLWSPASTKPAHYTTGIRNEWPNQFNEARLSFLYCAHKKPLVSLEALPRLYLLERPVL